MNVPNADNLNIKLNQNLWGLIASLGSLGASEYFELSTLYWFSTVVAAVMTLSISVTTFAYTRYYWQEKSR